MGLLMFHQVSPDSDIRVTGTLIGVIPGNSRHGMHVHTLGDLSNPNCAGSLDHFNPIGNVHGGLNDATRHLGDLGNIRSDASGTASIEIEIPSKNLPLVGPYSIIGRMVVVHSGEDDLGLGTAATSSTTGNSGSRIGCGIIGIASERLEPGRGNFIENYNSTGATRKATARVIASDGRTLLGVVSFEQQAEGDDIILSGDLNGLQPVGQDHGIAVHELGDLSTRDCKSSGTHYNPLGTSHGYPGTQPRHAGDLGNVSIDSGGHVTLDKSMKPEELPMVGVNTIIGRMFVIHEKPDDGGLAGTNASKTDGNSGDPIGCGVIGIASDFSVFSLPPSSAVSHHCWIPSNVFSLSFLFVMSGSFISLRSTCLS